MHFKGRLASGPDDICDLFADFIQPTYADDGCLLILDQISCRKIHQFGALQFTVDKVQCFARVGKVWAPMA
jgi:hypothetical protein